MLDHFWQTFLRGQMTRIQEPDLLIDHDSGGGGPGSGCHRFFGGPVEPFTYSGVNHMKSSGGSSGKWFPFPSITSPSASRLKKGEAVTFSSTSTSCGKEEKPIIVVHNNNNNIILDMMDENTRWTTSSTKNRDNVLSPCKNSIHPPSVILPKNNGITTNKTKSKLSVSNNHNSTSSKSKNNNKNNASNGISNMNNCSAGAASINKAATNSRINNCGPTSVTSGSHINNSRTSHHHHGGNHGDEDSGARHLIVRYIHCRERPSKKQLVTLGIISVVFLILLVVLLALFLSPSSRRALDVSGNIRKEEISDAFISSDITTSLNSDDVDLDDSDSYDDSDSSYYSSTSSSASASASNGHTNTGLDLKKVSKLSWDLLNSNQDASTRGTSRNGGGGGSSLGSFPPLTSNGEGEIILPAKMIYTSSGGATDLIPSENANGGAGSGGNKKRSCCRTQKYSQVIKREGCEPLTIVNKMCFGQCVSVWVPGLFASFPVCRPSKSTFKMVTLTCGRNREKRKRVRIEKVRRCSCMEIEPTAASL